MCKPAVTRTLQPGVTSTSLVWNGPKRNDSTLRIEIRNGLAGKESARISGHKLPRWFHFGVRWDGWLGLSESCGGRETILVISLGAAVSVCAISLKNPPHTPTSPAPIHRRVAKP